MGIAANLAPITAEPSAWYVGAMERLVEVVQELSRAKTVDAVTAIIRRAARELTGADGAAFVLRDGNQCYYAEENAIAPLWKGRRFPMDICVSGWAMLHAESVVIDDIYTDARVPHEAYRPTFVKSLAMVPIRRNAPIGAIGNYWASNRTPTSEEMAILQALADTTSVALENAQLYADLQSNITILRQRENRIQEQHESLEVFTRALAHDLKEPALTINSFSNILSQGENFNGKEATYLGHIRKASAHMLMLIETVFNYIQIDGPRELPREECDIDKLVQEVSETMSQLVSEKKAIIATKNLPILNANRAQLMQVFQNLICNAIRHNTASVFITISAQHTDEGWVFCVADNGVGIEKEYFDKIFQPFKRMTRHEESAGLGLSICRKIVEAGNGKIWCESKPGQGASFFFTIPEKQAAT